MDDLPPGPLQYPRFLYYLHPQKVNIVGGPSAFFQRINEERREVGRLSVQYAGVDLIQGLAVQTLHIFQISPPGLQLLINR